MTPTLPALDPAIFPAEVLALSAERGVSDYLMSVYDLTKRCFPGADVFTTFDVDYEEADLAWIVFHVARGSRDEKVLHDQYHSYIDEKIRLLPPDARGAFSTSVE